MKIRLAAIVLTFSISRIVLAEDLVLSYQSVLKEIPESCAETSKKAIDLYNKGRFIDFDGGPNINYLPRSYELRSNTIEYVVPVDSYSVFYLKPLMTMQFVSLFVNCEKKLAYISSRGDPSGRESWAGPFNIE